MCFCLPYMAFGMMWQHEKYSYRVIRLQFWQFLFMTPNRGVGTIIQRLDLHPNSREKVYLAKLRQPIFLAIQLFIAGQNVTSWFLVALMFRSVCFQTGQNMYRFWSHIWLKIILEFLVFLKCFGNKSGVQGSRFGWILDMSPNLNSPC